MDLLKQLTGKNPSEFESAAKHLVDDCNTDLFEKLVKQDDFLFDFIKENVAKRIQAACNENNYRNLLNFTRYYSPFYDTMIAEVLFSYSSNSLLPDIKVLLYNGTEEQKAYAVKYLTFVPTSQLTDLLPKIREYAESDYEPLQNNSIELLATIGDTELKNKALNKLDSDDEFTQYDGIKFLVTYQAKEAIDKIISIMKKSSLAENIAAEIPYLTDLSEYLDTNFDDTVLILCNIINAIPDIISIQSVADYNLEYIIDKILTNKLTSSSAILIRLIKDKFEEFTSNDEYLFDCDTKTKELIKNLYQRVKIFKNNMLESLICDELYEDSDFVLFAIDFVNEKEELETLLDSTNPTILLKTLASLKEKELLTSEHKNIALSHIKDEGLKQIAEVL